MRADMLLKAGRSSGSGSNCNCSKHDWVVAQEQLQLPGGSSQKERKYQYI